MSHDTRPDVPCECHTCTPRLDAYTREARRSRQHAEQWEAASGDHRRCLVAVIDNARHGATRGELANIAARHLNWSTPELASLAEELADRSEFRIDGIKFREFDVDAARIPNRPESPVSSPAPESAFARACESTRLQFLAEDTGTDIELTHDTHCEACGDAQGPGRRALGLVGCLDCWEDGSMTSGIEEKAR